MDQIITLADARSELLRGIRESIPVVLGILPAALVLGAQAATKGLSLVEVPLMTGLNFGGGSEFAAVALWTSPPHILLIVAITLLINSRHLLMGAALAPLISHVAQRRALPLLFFMCDESWAMGLADARRSRRNLSVGYFLGVSLSIYGPWVGFTAIGAFIGPFLGDIRFYGFDMAIPAVYLVMLAGMWTGVKNALPWAISLFVAGTVYSCLPGGWYVPAGAVAGLATSFLLACNA